MKNRALIGRYGRNGREHHANPWRLLLRKFDEGRRRRLGSKTMMYVLKLGSE